MCRKSIACPELDINSHRWDNYCPLKPSNWFKDQLDIFACAVEEFINDSRSRSLEILETIPSKELQ